ncbi:MAG: hypothetical protein O6918_01070 [Deltaproteobacteria bacterium]|nr:hypothetical protein [Deltaproteobacteria bacterium]
MSARFLVKRLGEEVRQGALGKKGNWLVEAGGDHVVGKSSRKGLLHRRKPRTGVLSVDEGKGNGRSELLERLRNKNLKGIRKGNLEEAFRGVRDGVENVD